MLVLLSPAKKQNFDQQQEYVLDYSVIPFQSKTHELVERMRQFSPEELKALMGISTKLADLNVNRYLAYSLDSNAADHSSQAALLAFRGDVYQAFDASTLSIEDMNFAQHHIGILSGLYGLLRPLDLIQPHRLEMGTKVSCGDHQNLYDFWRQSVTDLINQRLATAAHPVVINLASQEYSQVVDTKHLKADWLTIQFKENRGGQYKTIGILAKRARGMMARFIVDNQIQRMSDLKKFDGQGYCYNAALSQADIWVFSR